MTTTTIFRLPPNVPASRQAVKASFIHAGAPRNGTFYFYPKKDFYRVSCASKNFGQVIIIKTPKGWQATHCRNAGQNAYEPTGVASKEYPTPDATLTDPTLLAAWVASDDEATKQ